MGGPDSLIEITNIGTDTDVLSQQNNVLLKWMLKSARFSLHNYSMRYLPSNEKHKASFSFSRGVLAHEIARNNFSNYYSMLALCMLKTCTIYIIWLNLRNTHELLKQHVYGSKQTFFFCYGHVFLVN